MLGKPPPLGSVYELGSHAVGLAGRLLSADLGDAVAAGGCPDHDPVVGAEQIVDLVAEPENLSHEGEDLLVPRRTGWQRHRASVIDEVVGDGVSEAPPPVPQRTAK